MGLSTGDMIFTAGTVGVLLVALLAFFFLTLKVHDQLVATLMHTQIRASRTTLRLAQVELIKAFYQHSCALHAKETHQRDTPEGGTPEGHTRGTYQRDISEGHIKAAHWRETSKGHTRGTHQRHTRGTHPEGHQRDTSEGNPDTPRGTHHDRPGQEPGPSRPSCRAPWLVAWAWRSKHCSHNNPNNPTNPYDPTNPNNPKNHNSPNDPK